MYQPVSVRFFLILAAISMLLGSCCPRIEEQEETKIVIQPINHAEISKSHASVAIRQVTLIDGRGGDALPDYTVIITDRVMLNGVWVE